MRIRNIREIEKAIYKIKAVDIMSRFAITISPDATVTDLAHLLMRFKISGVPVVDASHNIIGIVTATDLFEFMKSIVKEFGDKQSKMENKTHLVKDIMTEGVITICEDTSLFEAIKLMCDKNIHTLPVMADKEIVGVIGRRDIIYNFYAQEER